MNPGGVFDLKEVCLIKGEVGLCVGVGVCLGSDRPDGQAVHSRAK